MIAIVVMIAATAVPGSIAVHPSPVASALTERFVRDLRTKNIGDVVTLYTRDAVFVNPDRRFVGREAIRALYGQVAATYDSDLVLAPSAVSRGTGVETDEGTWRERLRSRKTGAVNAYRGTYRFTLRRQPDGRWMFSRMEWTLAGGAKLQ